MPSGTQISGAINALAREVADLAGSEVSDILELAVVGNPVMHHLFLGIDPTELGGAPFALATNEAITLWERGEELYRDCSEKLDAAHGRIEELARRVEAVKP